MTRQLVVAGIDPGTTAAYAVVDLRGRLLKAESGKKLEIKSVLREVTEVGKLLAVGTDRMTCPGMIEKLAATARARIVLPKQDLKVSEKEGLLRGAGYLGVLRNGHEKDAAAAAMYAYRELRPLLARIERILEKEGKKRLLSRVTERVVMTGRNIREVLRNVESEKSGIRSLETAKSVSAEKKNDVAERAEPSTLRTEYVVKENEILRKYNSKLRSRLGRLKQKLDKARKEIDAWKIKEERSLEGKLGQHREIVSKLHAVIRKRDDEVGGLVEEKRKLNEMLGKGGVLIKKLETLGYDEFMQKNRILNIRDNDWVLVARPEAYSEKTLRCLSEKSVKVLVRQEAAQKPVERLRQAELRVFNLSDAELLDTKHFASVSENELKAKLRGQNTLSVIGIIERYKEGRKSPVMDGND